tara:strand:- start:12765 stop:13661 length:897 start_codon:yes stop_codon:yes gene_type:complete
MKLFLKNSFLLFFVLLNIKTFPSAGNEKILRIGAIPDQNQEFLDRRFNLFSSKLSKELDIKVKYIPVFNYVAAVSGFRMKDLDLVWFGGLSGVQARLQTPNSIILGQRELDKKFRSVFIINKKVKIKPAENIEDLIKLKKLRFTFGSENSTSGRLMPQYYLNMAGINLNDFKNKRVGFSGSHDATLALVNSGSFEGGALNKQVWDRNLKTNKRRTKNVQLFWVTPPYADYHWLAQGDLDKKFRKGFTNELKSIILNLDIENKNDREILKMFGAKKFIPAEVSQYNNIEKIGRTLKKIK